MLTFILPQEFSDAFADSPRRFFVEIDGQTYGVRYNITNALYFAAKSDEEQKTIMIEIRPSASGKLNVQLPCLNRIK